MTRFTLCASRRPLLGAVALASGLLAGPLTAGHVGATFSTCDLDPRVYLSNGAQLNLNASVTDSPEDIASIVYTVHVPEGTTISRVVYPQRKYHVDEAVNVQDDSAAHTYDIHTVVTTLTPDVPVTATASLAGKVDKKPAASMAGQAGDDLEIQLTDS